MNLKPHKKAVADGLAYARALYRQENKLTLSLGIIHALSGNLYCAKDSDCDRRLIKLPTHPCDPTYVFDRQRNILWKTLSKPYDTDRKLINAVIRDLYAAKLLSKTTLPAIVEDNRPDNPVAFVSENGSDHSTQIHVRAL